MLCFNSKIIGGHDMSLTKFSGSSFPNGIWFRSDKYDSLVVEEEIVNGEIREKVYYEGSDEEFTAIKKYSKKSLVFLAVFVILTHFILFAMTFRYLRITEYSWYVTAYLGLWMLIASHNISILMTQIVVFNILPEGRRGKKFHGAEHKAFKAYRTSDGCPTYDLIKAASRFNDRCSSRTTVIKPLISIAKVLTIIKLGGNIHFLLLILVVNIISYGLSYLLINSKVDMIFQWVFVGNPTESELEVAYKGIQTLKAAEDSLTEKNIS